MNEGLSDLLEIELPGLIVRSVLLELPESEVGSSVPLLDRLPLLEVNEGTVLWVVLKFE